MKTKITLLFTILFSCYSFGQTVGQTFKSGDLNYKITSTNTVEVYSVSNNVADFIIPEYVTYIAKDYIVNRIGVEAFSRAFNIVSVTIPNSVTSIGQEAFWGRITLKSIVMSNAVTEIGDKAFFKCSFSSIVLPNSLLSIGVAAFEVCTALASITIPNSVTYMGNAVFLGCSGLKSVTFDNGLTSISPFTFAECKALTSVTIPVSITTIGTQAFKNCSGLITIDIPKSVSIIESSAFSGCINLTSISWPNTTTINYGMFESCSSLTSFTIPNSVTSIDYGAFSGAGLTSITIPNTVQSIFQGAFMNCYGLKSMTVNWTTPLNINADVFTNVNLSIITLSVPAGTETTYKSTLVWKDFGKVATLATNNLSLNNKINFYPNPAQSHITFPIEITTLDVFDIAGKKVKSVQITSTIFDVSALEKGIYILKGETSDGKSINEKLIKE